MRESRSRSGASPAGNAFRRSRTAGGNGPGPRWLLGRMPERRWRVLGRGRGLFAIEVVTNLLMPSVDGRECPTEYSCPVGGRRWHYFSFKG